MLLRVVLLVLLLSCALAFTCSLASTLASTLGLLAARADLQVLLQVLSHLVDLRIQRAVFGLRFCRSLRVCKVKGQGGLPWYAILFLRGFAEGCSTGLLVWQAVLRFRC